ncbi:hypothetical protein [Clostridium beijerinckii]|uniref:Uncharacterized protein n=1 Tax=Clostridium beijerinckii TaxID=1520 RepID=A0A1S8S0W8_CLOBE|nr:hypothetical protein [Clostridium beijerinckii]NRY63015.1 4-hydroxybutyrate CoA-transferase [Clostridium beijerinckii]OOM59098.1 hypothetical protein CLBCK_36510 [Clostridium beijerinckii]
MEIGIRYCGGCNTSYDRKAFVENLITDLDKTHNFEIAKEDKLYDYLILVCGCFNCCVSYEKYISNNKIFIKSINDYANLLSNLKEF